MEAVNENPLRMLEIEEELAGPGSAEALARYDGELVELAARAKRAMDAGVPPDEYRGIEELSEAVTVARKILRLAVRKQDFDASRK